MELTAKQQRIYTAFLELYQQKQEAIKPTEIGLHLGVSYDQASSYCTSTLKKFISLGKAKREGNGRYIPL